MELRRCFLGVVATLPAAETSRNYSIFFNKLRIIIEGLYPNTLKVETILTDESQSKIAAISKAFRNRVTIENCIWDKGIIFEKNLDVFGVKAAKAALYALTEIEFFQYIPSLVAAYAQRYDETKDLIKKRENSISKKYIFKWSIITRDKSKKFTQIKV